MAACGRSLPSRANTVDLASSPSSKPSRACRQGLPVEGNAIDTETARLDHAEIGRVPSHCEKTPYPLQPIVVVVQRIRVDQEHQRRVLPFVYRLHHAQRGVSVAACRHQRRVGQKLRALVVKQAQGGRIGPEFGEGIAHVSHRRLQAARSDGLSCLSSPRWLVGTAWADRSGLTAPSHPDGARVARPENRHTPGRVRQDSAFVIANSLSRSSIATTSRTCSRFRPFSYATDLMRASTASAGVHSSLTWLKASS